MILALALAFFAQTPAPRIEDIGERRKFEDAQRALEADESLLDLHRGLQTYLSADDELRQAEEGYDAIMQLSRLRERVENFEEVLIADTTARADFARCYARMQRDPALHEAVNALGVIEMEAHSGAGELVRSFAYLRAHPQATIPFLMQRQPGAVVLEELRPLRDAFRHDAPLQTRLREAWMAVDAQAGAREAVYPWWARVYGGSAAAAKRYLALDAALADFPSQRRAWETRELAWASRPEAVPWRDHVYARMRRHPALAPIYFDYLHTLRTHPDVEKYMEDGFAAKHGAPPTWPPQGTPPRLATWQRPEPITQPRKPAGPGAPAYNEPHLDRPKSPTINRPAAPTQPVAPERATSPVAPTEPPF